MTKLTKSLEERFKKIKHFQKILQAASARDINESDTVIIIRDILTEVLGYDKYSEITTEYNIRGTFCDLAIRIDGKPRFLIEAKAINIQLKEPHIRQAVNYASNEGIDWVILTNGIIWQVYKISFQKPIISELVFTIDLLSFDSKDPRIVEMLYLLSKEGLAKSAIDDFHSIHKAINRFSITAMLLSEPLITTIRRELRRFNQNLKIDADRISEIIKAEIVKRDILEDERFQKESKRLTREKQIKIAKNNSTTVAKSTQDEINDGGSEVKPDDSNLNST